MSVAIPDPRLLRPELLIPGCKPLRGVTVDRAHWAGAAMVEGWLFNDGDGDGLLFDLNLDTHGAPALVLDDNTYVDLDGSADSYKLLTGFDAASVVPEGTMHVRVRTDWDDTSASTQDTYLWTFGSGGGFTQGLRWQGGGGHRWIMYLNGGGAVVYDPAQDHTDFFWLTVSWGAAGLYVYVDGALVYSNAANSVMTSATDGLTFGASYHTVSTPYPMDGALESAWLFNQQFDADQVQSLTTDPYQQLTAIGKPLMFVSSGTIKFVSDAASATEGSGLTAGLGVIDSASATDSPPGVSVVQQVVDTVLAVDHILGLSALITVTGTAHGSEEVSSNAALSLSDAGSISDSVAQTVVIVVPEMATAADITSLITNAIKIVSDSGSASDAVSISANVSAIDSALAADQAVITVNLSVADAASAVEQLTLLTDTLKTVNETAGAIDQLSLNASMISMDSASALDQPLVHVVLQVADGGSIVESVTKIEQVMKSVSEVASIAEGLSMTIQVAASESAVAVDHVSASALLSVIESAGATDVVIRYIPGTTTIASISFNLKPRNITAALKSRGVSFKLQ